MGFKRAGGGGLPKSSIGPTCPLIFPPQSLHLTATP